LRMSSVVELKKFLALSRILGFMPILNVLVIVLLSLAFNYLCLGGTQELEW
jgi:hypothetical protein